MVVIMAVRYFLRIDDIKGESKDSKHKEEIEVLSYTWGVNQSGSFDPGGGGGAGRASFSDFSFMMPQSVASPVLMLSCASGKHLKEALLTARRSGKAGADHFKLTFYDLLISSFQESASDDSAPTESCSFNFSKFEMEYRQQNTKGQLGPPVKAGWDLKKNEAF
jgi:type VI secretion system secreted protein Hcp